MFDPSFDEVRALSRNYSMIPICKRIFTDTETPVRLFHRMGKRPFSFLLESAENGERQGRFSFMGADPFLIFQCRENWVTLTQQGETRSFHTRNPLKELDQLLDRYRAPIYTDFPPFLGGAVGYIGHGFINSLEPISRHPKDLKRDAWDLHLMFCDRLMVMDHLKQEIILVQNISVTPGDDYHSLRRRYDEALNGLDSWWQELWQQEPENGFLPVLTSVREDTSMSKAISHMTPKEYCHMVSRCLEHIGRGDVLQIVPSQRWTWPDAPPAMDVYRILRGLNPSPYMYYLSLGDEEVVGASPELLVRVMEGQVETRPIAGTRHRGKTPAEDQELAAELLKDKKELTEHAMLVDLGRHDLGKVCRYGSVQVEDERRIEKYSHVMHMVSHVTGELAKGYRPLDAFRAAFPAGTVSGAPKVRALQLLAEMEPEPRGIYSGAIGYFSFTGNLDSCITIRTLHFRDGEALIQAGGGVVADSIPEKEYEESCNKAKGMIQALSLAENLYSITAKR